ncbi:MAG: acylneuraminate cytidylyltransferase [Acidobacteria bacterium]|jgi:CMP-N-acetylneuraminic acid synthetase|nr:acylneuraminate cytidylyltransferase [Acidobacteriota bacterium]|tara:strand:- start:1269 stop:1994 length:726 start_codon:yes stop_codon:yes gene_type:complete
MVKGVVDKSNIIGIIHARGGSRRIPLKNIKHLNGVPLIGYIIKAALGSKLLDRVIVSSDHPEIIRLSKEFGAEVPFVRPADLAEDVPSELVTQHAVEFIEAETRERVDIAVTMQSTSPFCSSEDIDTCIRKLTDNPEIESVFTAKKVCERPEWMFKLDKDKAVLFLGGEMKGERGVTQSLPDLYIPNGAVYATRRNVLFEKNILISDMVSIHEMSAERSIDIDEPIDFLVAEVVGEQNEQG